MRPLSFDSAGFISRVYVILRVMRARLSHRDAPELLQRVRALIEARPDGLLDACWGVQEDEQASSLLVTSTWRDLESIYHAVGGHDLLWDAALLEGIGERVQDLEVQHYSVEGSTHTSMLARSGGTDALAVGGR
jgi:hypothetical protein